jgi:hypothetical protein
MRISSAMRALRLFCLLPLLLGLCQCSWLLNKTAGLFKKKPAKDNRVGEAKVVGIIELVNPEQNYVLINCEQRLHIPAGTEVISQKTDGSKTRLKVTPERKGNYITADIVEGSPDVRDLVLYQVKPGDLPAQAAQPGASPTDTPQVPAVPLTPIMQADVIPPLGTPFQPVTPAQPSPTTVPPGQLPATTPSPAPAGPEPDLSKLLPVVR